MTLIVLSLGSAIVYGAADFFGGAASRRAPVRSVLLVSLPIGLAVLIAVALATGTAVSPHGLVWGVAGGLAGGAGLVVFYGALARGPMSVVAPVAALVSALLPVGAGLVRGERPASSALVGILVCLIAICLVSMEQPRPDSAAPDCVDADTIGPDAVDPDAVDPDWVNAGPADSGSPGSAAVGGQGGQVARPGPVRGPLLAALAGACFGVFFILLREAGRDGGLWALVAARAAGLAVVVAIGLVGWAMLRWSSKRSARTRSARTRSVRTRSVRTWPVRTWPVRTWPEPTEPVVSRLVSADSADSADSAVLWIAVMAGALDSLANILYIFAAQAGMLSLAAVLTSLYPAITVLLARVVYSERLRLVQRFGVVLALVGVALVTAG